MTALSLDGEKRKREELEFSRAARFFEFPILAGGMVVLANDQMDPKLPGTSPRYEHGSRKSFRSLRPQDGKTRWKVTEIGAGGLCDALHPPFGRADGGGLQNTATASQRSI